MDFAFRNFVKTLGKVLHNSDLGAQSEGDVLLASLADQRVYVTAYDENGKLHTIIVKLTIEGEV